MKTIQECLLYGIVDTGYVRDENILIMTKHLLQGGVDIIQLRAKKNSSEEILTMAKKMAPLCSAASVPFILNDHPELVREAGASGAHVGQEALSLAEARLLAGPNAIIGKSTHSLKQALETIKEAPDYIGFGPLFSTPTKPDYLPIGIQDLREVHNLISLPIFCIGGIKFTNLPEVLDAGARRVVIVSDLLLAEDPTERTASSKKLLKSRFPTS